jgi:hypothetical protein
MVVLPLLHRAFPVEEFVDVDAIERDRSQEVVNGQKRAGDRYRHIRQNAADPFRIQDIKDDMSVYGTEQEKKFYGAVQATQEGLSSVIQSARLSTIGGVDGTSTSNPPTPAATEREPDVQSPVTQDAGRRGGGGGGGLGGGGDRAGTPVLGAGGRVGGRAGDVEEGGAERKSTFPQVD